MVSWAITGASRGIGLEFIRQLSTDKNNLVFAIVRNTTSSPELTKLASEMSNVHIVQGDLTSLSQLQEAAKTIASITGGSLDILINNGAYLDPVTAPILPSQLSAPEHIENFKEAIDKCVESNVLGAIYLTNSFLPLIEQGKEKKIVHLTTGFADTDLVLGCEIAAFVPYSSSKAMLNAVVARYGIELRPKGIHVVAISPGWVDTSPMPEEAVSWLTSMFRKVDPKASRISPESSVRDQLETIAKLGWEVQGRAVSQHGNLDWF